MRTMLVCLFAIAIILAAIMGFGPNWAHLPSVQSPAAREGAGMTYDAFLRRVILFGGQDTNGYFNDTRELIP